MNVDELKKNLHDVIERYRNKAEFTGEVCRDVMARDCLQVVEELEAENERLTAELKQTEAQDQVVIDGLRKENAKLKCLALHVMRDLFDYKGHKLEFEGNKIWVKYCHKYNEFDKAYRKAKKELKEGR